MDEDLKSLLEDIQKNPHSNIQERYEYLREIDNWEELPTLVCINLIGKLIDYSFDLNKKDGLNEGAEICENLLQRDLSAKQISLVNYQFANVYGYRNQLRSKKENRFLWDNKDLNEELIRLRHALHKKGMNEIPKQTRLQIYTNYGSASSRAQRVIEAIESRNKALSEANFAMALGSRGINKHQYGRALYDPGHRKIFLASAHSDLEDALDSSNLHQSQKEVFEREKSKLEQYASEEPLPDNADEFSLGETNKEKRYRKWCLENVLYINPLNDITAKPIAAQDVFHLPSMTRELDEDFSFPGFYNQMKQEYVSARYLYYEGFNRDEPHFSDKEVMLYNTLDYPVYSYSAEQMKASLRMSYSIFDKIAIFLNEYFGFGHDEKSLTFENLWYENLNYEEGLKNFFHDNTENNWPLIALYWQKKDLYGGSLEVDDSAELIGKDLKTARNHLEHQYLKVHQFDRNLNDDTEEIGSIYKNELKFSISRRDLEEYGLKMLKMSRAALIYLSLAVTLEEYKNKNSDRPILQFKADKWEDEWKM